MIKPDQPVGVFDSGVGGLTVASAVKHLLPNERIIYFGDTAHLPYGDKSTETIIRYSKHIADFLLQRKVKVILIACNTASAVAYDALLDYLGKRANLVNVIDPVVNHIAENFSNQKVGVIGTKATINSGTYEGKIRTLNSSIEVVSLATPLLVPMIEEGFVYDDISNAIIKAYLSSDILDHIGSMILGCTHYPIVKEQIGEFFGSAVEIVDSPAIVAGYLKRILEDQALLNERKNPQHYFYISDYTEYFKNTARMFFKESINLEKLDIWKDPA